MAMALFRLVACAPCLASARAGVGHKSSRRLDAMTPSVTITSPSLNTSVASRPYGSVVLLHHKGERMRYIAPIVLALALAAGCGNAATSTSAPTPSPTHSVVSAAASSTSPGPSTSATPTPAPTPTPTLTHSAAPHTQPATTSAAAPPAASCYPTTNSGNCYEPGEYCRKSDHGASGVAGDGKKIICENNNGWRWEPV